MSSTEPQRPILILDDDKDLSTMMRRFLEHEGFRAVVVNDPLVAVESVLEAKPCLLLVDLMMPRIDGEAFVRAVQRVLGGDAPPMCLVSASHEREGAAARLGLPASLGKPFAMSALRDLATRFADAHRTPRA